MPFLIAWAAVKGGLKTALTIWTGLPGPVKAAILIVLAAVGGILWGEHDANRRCQGRINASIEAARDLDGSISAESKARADQQLAASKVREDTIRDEVTRYANDLATKTAAACRAGGDADRYNDGLDVRDDAVQPTREKPAPGGGHRAVTVPLPPRKGQ